MGIVQEFWWRANTTDPAPVRLGYLFDRLNPLTLDCVLVACFPDPSMPY